MWDADVGLYYDHARWYDPHTGRFISQDPSGFGAGDFNLYRYVGNDPMNFTDPRGLAAEASGEAAQMAQEEAAVRQPSRRARGCGPASPSRAIRAAAKWDIKDIKEKSRKAGVTVMTKR